MRNVECNDQMIQAHGMQTRVEEKCWLQCSDGPSSWARRWVHQWDAKSPISCDQFFQI